MSEPARPIVLVIDDEVRSQEALRRVLEDDFQVLTASSAAEAEGLLEGEMVQVILCDQRMPGISGVEFLKRVRELWPDPVRMIVSGYSDSEDIIAGVNDAGIYRYLTKPWEPDALIETVRGAVALFDLQRESHIAAVEIKQSPTVVRRAVERKKTTLKRLFEFDKILHAEGSPLGATIDLATRIAAYDMPVLLTGESGTGKELFARAIHYNSPRAGKPFVVENCGALPDQLLESELFGSKKGSFTGAYEDRIGLFEQANGGTIFLDEIGETTPAFQVKLLRALQEGEIRPIGARLPRRVDVRVIAATNRDLSREVDEKRFRQDLYYRLAGFPLHLPALRERPDDVEMLARHLLGIYARQYDKPVREFTPDAMAALRRHRWPGNVREMQNLVQRLVVLCDDAVVPPALVAPYLDDGREEDAGDEDAGVLRQRIDIVEHRAILDALDRHKGNISRIAAELGLSRVGLRAKMKRLGIAKDAEG